MQQQPSLGTPKIAAWVRQCVITTLLVFAMLASASEVSLPLEFSRQRNAMTAMVGINGKRHRFLIDTGAEVTVVSQEVLGLNMVDLRQGVFSHNGPGMGGDAIFLRVNLTFASRTWGERSVAIMDLQQVRAVYGNDIDGLLGLDLLREFSSVKVDFKNRQLVLTN